MSASTVARSTHPQVRPWPWAGPVATILATSVAFYRRQPRAGLLLIPTLLWTSFAAVLNGTIWWMNRGL